MRCKPYEMLCAVGALSLTLSLAGCGGGSSSSGSGTVSVVPAPTPAPIPSPTPTPAASSLPPAPFGLTASADFALVGWQETSQGANSSMFALAEQKALFAWSSTLKTYTITLSDLASGRLVYTFPGNNPAAFSIIQADGSTAKVYVAVVPRTASVGDIFWQTADGVAPFVYARGLFGISVAPGSLPSSGRRVFATDSAPQSSLVFDFATRMVSGTITSFNDGGAWDPVGPKEQATLEPTQIQPDGSFVAVITIPGAPKTGELRGRLFGAAGNELGVYWNAPVRGYDQAFGDYRTVMSYPACSSCTG